LLPNKVSTIVDLETGQARGSSVRKGEPHGGRGASQFGAVNLMGCAVLSEFCKRLRIVVHGMRPRLFHLIRDEDHTGVSGTGIVAEGAMFSTGPVTLHWISNGHSSTALHDSLENLIAIHGHGDKTRVVFLDEWDTALEPDPRASSGSSESAIN
jgi:hypothetical protein